MATSSSSTATSNLVTRLVLYRGEVHRVPGGQFALRAVSGRAWVSYAGRDIVLRGGERANLPSARDFAVVSSLGRAPLVLEVLTAASRPPGGLRQAVPHGSML